MKALLSEIIKRLGSAAFRTGLRRGTNKILEQALKSQPEYRDMVAHGGKLRAELGVVDSEAAMNRLVRDWLASTQVRVARPRLLGKQFVGSIVTIQSIQADYQDVLSKAYASYTTERGEVIPWLEWLLTQGSDTMIMSHVAWNPLNPTIASRTGTNTVMKKSRGKGWGVPSEYAGTPEDNLATRAVADSMREILELVKKESTRRL
jgi:hypothetical protein